MNFYKVITLKIMLLAGSRIWTLLRDNRSWYIPK